MFEYVKLKNFKTFNNIEVSFLDRNNNPKKMVLIYGENGAGKTSLAKAFYVLAQSIIACGPMIRDERLNSILSDNTYNFEEKDKKNLPYVTINNIFRDNRTKGSDEPLYMEFGFRIEGKSGKYILEMDNSIIIHERLEYLLNQRRGAYFDITKKKVTINPSIFLDKNDYSNIKKTCKQYWGKQSFLSIIYRQFFIGNGIFDVNQLESKFVLLLQFLFNLSCRITAGNSSNYKTIWPSSQILSNVLTGSIPRENQETVRYTEKMINDVLPLVDKDTCLVEYKWSDINEKTIKYTLYVDKLVKGKPRKFRYDELPSGIISLITLIPFIKSSEKESVIVIDNIDLWLHDIIIKKLGSSLYDNIQSQLILTTHSTIMMESNLPKECFYVINKLDIGEREIQCILHYNNKIGEKNNIRNQYLIDRYTSNPGNHFLDDSVLMNMFQSSKEKES